MERSIQFYRIDIGLDESNLPIPYNPFPAFNAIQKLITTPDWYEEEIDGNALCLVPSANQYSYPVARFCRVRRRGLPQLESKGLISDLDIAESQGLLESTHVVFLPDNVIGTEYNHYGPRISRIGSHLRNKSSGEVPRARIGPVFRKDVAKKLDNLQELHLLDMQVVPSAAQIVEQIHQPLGAALRALAAIPQNSLTLQLTLRPTKAAESSFLSDLLNPLKEMLASMPFRQGAKQLKVEGRPQDARKLELIDLLKDDITAQRNMILLTPRGRALDSNAAFLKIIQTYEELQSEIKESPSLVGSLGDGDVHDG